MTPPEDITAWADRLESATKDSFVDRVVVLNETASTQDAAARGGIGLPDDHPATVVVASTQTAGRGQRSNDWHDASRLTLPCSIAIGKSRLKLDSPNLAARSGLATLDAVQHFASGHRIQIKWPNDILVAVGESAGEPAGEAQKKISGILIEHINNSIVIGIGINCLQTENDFHPSIRDTAVSLAQLGTGVTRIDLACKLIASLNHWLCIATQDDIRTHWEQHDALVGLEKSFVYNNQTIAGKVLSIDPLKEIRVQTNQGRTALPVEHSRLSS